MNDASCDLLCLDLPKAEKLRMRVMDADQAEDAARGFKALGDPTRLTLAAALGDGEELCVCDLAWISGRAENLVSHHVRQLHAGGLVDRRRDGKMVMYSLNDRGRALLDMALGSARATK